MAAIEIIQLVSTILGMSSVVIGVIFSILSVRRFNRKRKLSLFMQYHSRSAQIEFLTIMMEINNLWSWDNIDDFWKKYGPITNPESFAKFISVGSYFDGMGLLLRTNNISVDYLPELTITSILNFWTKIEPIHKDFARDLKRSDSFVNIKYLYDEIIKHELLDHV